MSKFDPYYRSLSDFQKRLQRYFPQRQIILRTDEKMHTLRFTTMHQALATCIVIVVGGWLFVSSGLVVSHTDRIRAKEIQINDARSGYEQLLAQLNVYNRRINDITNDLNKNSLLMVSLAEQQLELLEKKSSEIESKSKSTKVSKRSLNSKDNQVPLPRKIDVAIGRLELERMRVSERSSALSTYLEQLKDDMIEVTRVHQGTEFVDAKALNARRLNIELNLAASETVGLLSKVNSLEDQIRDLESVQLMLFDRFSVVAEQKIDHITSSLKTTGLQVDKLLEDKRNESGRGGPFIPIDLEKSDNGPLHDSLIALNMQVGHLTELENLTRVMPLQKPLKKYWITSGYGVRKDPITGTYARHLGLDFGGPLREEIISPGSGRVVFAGWRGRYGNLVEIDHGMGLTSRYGHLAKILTAKGQYVSRGSKIGLLGNSGRSTGPHLHFEVLYKGKQLNPMKFMRVGNNVLKEG